MEHPQPVFDVLLSLPGEKPPGKNIFEDWSGYVREAEISDDIRNYPEIWEYFELPETLEDLERDDVVAIQTFEGSLNLNALAIGLGLENIRYAPERFPALVYEPPSTDALVFVWGFEVIVSVPSESDDTSEASSGVEQLVHRLDELDLAENAELDEAITTHRISDIISVKGDI